MIYFDNAATTPLDPSVFEEMKPFLLEHFGNPSSMHKAGRQVRTAIEKARKEVAQCVGVSGANVVFTSGATEANNLALRGAVLSGKIKTIISSPIEHHAVLNTVEDLKSHVSVEIVKVDSLGRIDLDDLRNLLSNNTNCLVSIMHGNNELGNLNPIKEIGSICKAFDAQFHCDTVQTVGLGLVDLKDIHADYIVGSAHKFYGPKGIGFLVKRTDDLEPVVTGGGQERGLRSGTENVSGIVGLASALKLATQNAAETRQHLSNLKTYLTQKIKSDFPDFKFNGLSADLEDSLPGVLNFSLTHNANSMTLFNLDIAGIAVSGGSACSSGALKGSHVLNAINPGDKSLTFRVSFGKQNTVDEIDFFVETLKDIL